MRGPKEGRDAPGGREATFEALWNRWHWRPIRGCGGRFVLVGEDARLPPEGLAGEGADLRRYRVEGARDEVVVAALDVGGLISYRRSDGTFVHTLNSSEGFARKLARLGIEAPSLHARDADDVRRG